MLAVTTSEIKVSALIAESELELAVRVLHTAFGLDEQVRGSDDANAAAAAAAAGGAA
jgi:aspartate kinase